MEGDNDGTPSPCFLRLGMDDNGEDCRTKKADVGWGTLRRKKVTTITVVREAPIVFMYVTKAFLVLLSIVVETSPSSCWCTILYGVRYVSFGWCLDPHDVIKFEMTYRHSTYEGAHPKYKYNSLAVDSDNNFNSSGQVNDEHLIARLEQILLSLISESLRN